MTRRAASDPARLGILLSGRGSNFLALQAAIERGDLPAHIVLVVSNKPDAPGLAKAAELGLDTAAIPRRVPREGPRDSPRKGPQKGPQTGQLSREAHERKIVEALQAASVEWVCLAGYMRVLSGELLRAYPQRIVNIHPSLLPAFPGLHAQRQAWEYGVRVAGCTVHLVDAGVDTGPIVEQRSVEVRDGESAEQLAARILEQEHLAYPAALRRLLTEEWWVEGRRLRFLAP